MNALREEQRRRVERLVARQQDTKRSVARGTDEDAELVESFLEMALTCIGMRTTGPTSISTRFNATANAGTAAPSRRVAVRRGRGRARRGSVASRQRFPQRLRRLPHLRHVRLVLGLCRFQIGSAEGAIFPAVHSHEAPTAAAEAQGNRDAAAFSH
jgi:hypothetical protein